MVLDASVPVMTVIDSTFLCTQRARNATPLLAVRIMWVYVRALPGEQGADALAEGARKRLVLT
jgi:hypothetical protein